MLSTSTHIKIYVPYRKNKNKNMALLLAAGLSHFYAAVLGWFVALKPSLKWNGDNSVCGSARLAAGRRLQLSRLKTRRKPRWRPVASFCCVSSSCAIFSCSTTSHRTTRPDSSPVLHAASHSPVAFTRGQRRQSRNIWRYFYFPSSPLRGLFVSFLSECQAFAWVSKQTSSSRNDVSEKCHWSGMSCQSLCWANDYFWVLWELKV